MLSRYFHCSGVTFVLVALCAAPVLAGIQYEIIQIENTPGGSSVVANDINNDGLVVGQHSPTLVTSNNYRPFVWRQGDATLTSLGSYHSGGDGQGAATAVSEQGHVVGWTHTSYNNDDAFLWTQTGGMRVCFQSLGGNNRQPQGINDAGTVVVGWGQQMDSQHRAVKWTWDATASGGNGGYLYEILPDLGTGDRAGAQGMNEFGQIVGWSRYQSISPTSTRPCLWTAGGVEQLPELETLPDDVDWFSTNAANINDAGLIVGTSQVTGYKYRAVYWAKNTSTGLYEIHDLGHLGTDSGNKAHGCNVNNAGQIVGYSQDDGNNDYHAFIHQNGQMTKLQDLVVNWGGSAWTRLYRPLGINNKGQIVGQGLSGSLTSRGFLLNPVYFGDGDFGDGDLGDWTAGGDGDVDVVDPGGGDYCAQFTAGSPAILFQDVATPDTIFELSFDYEFLTTDPLADLMVELEGTLLDTLVAPGTLVDDFTEHTITVTDSALQGLDAAQLEFTFDGPSGHQMLLDNVRIVQTPPIPEPSTLALLCMAAFGLLVYWVRGRG